MAEILECPFCESLEVIVNRTNCHFCWISCNDCGGQADGGATREEAIQKWNGRRTGRVATVVEDDDAEYDCSGKDDGELEDVVIVNPLLSFMGMIVCVKDGLEDDVILKQCNRLNPSGTSGGWSVVVRTVEQSFFQDDDGQPSDLPVPCDTYPGRTHFVVLC